MSIPLQSRPPSGSRTPHLNKASDRPRGVRSEAHSLPRAAAAVGDRTEVGMNHLLGASDAHVRADVPADVPARSANRRAGSWLVLIALGAASVLAACSSS